MTSAAELTVIKDLLTAAMTFSEKAQAEDDAKKVMDEWAGGESYCIAEETSLVHINAEEALDAARYALEAAARLCTAEAISAILSPHLATPIATTGRGPAMAGEVREAVLTALQATVTAYEVAGEVAGGVHGATARIDVAALEAWSAADRAHWAALLGGPARDHRQVLKEVELQAAAAAAIAETTVYIPPGHDASRLSEIREKLQEARAALAAFEKGTQA